jgi:DNA invertase Pin-like site-specific DNA recombinase
MSKRVFIYHRVSKDDGSQDETKILDQLREDCSSNHWQIVGEYVERESGRKGRLERKQFDKMLKDAPKLKPDFVYFFALDRFSRQGINPTIRYLQILETHNINFKSKLEPFLDTENELIRHILIALLAYIAKFESDRTSARIKNDLAGAKKRGVILGRPSKFEQVKPMLESMVNSGFSDYKIGQTLNLKPDTVKVYRKKLTSAL